MALARDEKMRIARAWKPSGTTQEAYAARHGIAPRTLRSWVAQFAPEPSHEQVLKAIDEAIERLYALRAGLAAVPPGEPTGSAPPPSAEQRPADKVAPVRPEAATRQASGLTEKAPTPRRKAFDFG